MTPSFDDFRLETAGVTQKLPDHICLIFDRFALRICVLIPFLQKIDLPLESAFWYHFCKNFDKHFLEFKIDLRLSTKIDMDEPMRISSGGSKIDLELKRLLRFGYCLSPAKSLTIQLEKEFKILRNLERSCKIESP